MDENIRPLRDIMKTLQMSSCRAYPHDVLIPQPNEECPTCKDDFALSMVDQYRAIRLQECGHIVGDKCFNEWMQRQPGRCLNWNHPLTVHPKPQEIVWDQLMKPEEYWSFNRCDTVITEVLNMCPKKPFLGVELLKHLVAKEKKHRDAATNYRLCREGSDHLRLTTKISAAICFVGRTAYVVSRWLWVFVVIKLILRVLLYLSNTVAVYFPMLSDLTTSWWLSEHLWAIALIAFWVVDGLGVVGTLLSQVLSYVRVANKLLDLALEKNYDGEEPARRQVIA